LLFDEFISQTDKLRPGRVREGTDLARYRLGTMRVDGEKLGIRTLRDWFSLLTIAQSRTMRLRRIILELLSKLLPVEGTEHDVALVIFSKYRSNWLAKLDLLRSVRVVLQVLVALLLPLVQSVREVLERRRARLCHLCLLNLFAR
jgi:hypothetical protein